MSNLASIKLPADLVEDARIEGALFSRSISGQVEHWARLGQALEAMPGFPLSRVRAALEGRVDEAALSDDEMRMLDELRFAAPSDEERAFYAELGTRPGAVGLNDAGEIERVHPDGGIEIVRR